MQYKTPVITTPRLTLRAPILTDIEAFQAAKEEVWDDLQNWMSWSSDEQKTIEATKDFFQKTQTDGSSILLGVDPTTDDFIIATGIDVLGPDEYSTGYWVSKKYLGQGYATEACNAILRYIFATRQVKAVHIDHFEGNDKARTSSANWVFYLRA